MRDPSQAKTEPTPSPRQANPSKARSNPAQPSPTQPNPIRPTPFQPRPTQYIHYCLSTAFISHPPPAMSDLVCRHLQHYHRLFMPPPSSPAVHRFVLGSASSSLSSAGASHRSSRVGDGRRPLSPRDGLVTVGQIQAQVSTGVHSDSGGAHRSPYELAPVCVCVFFVFQ